MIQFLSFELTYYQVGIITLVAVLIGTAKTGVHGSGMIAVPLLASIFGGKLSSGLLLPILSLADVFGVIYYHKHASWPHLKKLFPWAAVGVVLGTVTGAYIDDEAFRLIMAIIIFGSVAIMLWLEQGNKEHVPDYYWFAILMGMAGGFTTMVGNLAGSVMALYLLSMKLPKNSFIGTAAWFFMVINWFKIPFHVFVWETITLDSFLLNLTTLPFIAVGAGLGILITRQIPEKAYRYFIIVMTLIAAVFMVI
ncbi:MAG: sulfite exporter TauE/SafE family protein [Cyclobacteriaceae bacterium]